MAIASYGFRALQGSDPVIGSPAGEDPEPPGEIIGCLRPGQLPGIIHFMAALGVRIFFEREQDVK